MTNNKDLLIKAMRFNIKEKEKYIRVLEEELYVIKRILRASKGPIIARYEFKELEEGEIC